MTNSLPSPFFLRAKAGLLHGVYFPPPDNTALRGCMLHVPAFGEEMNKSRVAVARAAAAFARNGIGVLVFDLYGTGDSQGEFEEGRWELWLDDVDTALGWLRENIHPRVCLWGLRFGTLLICDLLNTRPATGVSGLLFWAPLISGDQQLSQLQRIRTANEILGRRDGAAPEARPKTVDGEPLEVGGYVISPDIVSKLKQVRLRDVVAPEAVGLGLLEIRAGGVGDDLLSPPLQKFVDDWVAQGNPAETAVVRGTGFWLTQEISFLPEMCERSVKVWEKLLQR